MFKKKTTKELLGEKPSVAPKERKEKKEKKPLKEYFKNRLFLGGLCVTVALVLSFVVLPLVQSRVSQSTEVVRLREDIDVLKPGYRLSAEDVEIIAVGGYNLAADVVTSIDAAVGKYLKVSLLPGDVLQEKKLSSELVTDDKFLAELPAGKLAISVTIENLAQGLSGKLRTGDIVQVFAQSEDAAGKPITITPPTLQYIEILAVSNPSLEDIENGQNPEEVEKKQIATITLLADQKQGLALAGLNATSEIHLALAHRGEDETKATMLKTQETHNIKEDIK